MTKYRMTVERGQGGLEVWTMAVGTMPIAMEKRPALAAFLLALMHAGCDAYQLTESVWIEATEIHHEGGSKLLAPHARVWGPKIGFGVHPDGELPRMWTNEDFSEAPFGHEPPRFNNQVFQVSLPSGDANAVETMAGRGVLALLLLHGTAEGFKESMKTVLGPLVTERAWQMYPYYFPLLTAASGERSEAVAWMGTAMIYIREVFKDKMVVVLSRVGLERCLEAVGAQRVEDGVWEYEIPGETGR